MAYTTRNGVRYPDLMLEEPETAPGKYGLLRLRYLEKSDPGQLNILLLEGALNSHLAQIDRQVRGQVEQTMERLVQRTKLPDKQTDPLGWAGTMNSLRQQAEDYAKRLVNEDAIVREAEKKADEILSDAEEQCRMLKAAASEYCEDTLRRMEEAVADAYDEVKHSRAKFRSALSAASGVPAPLSHPAPRRAMYDADAD